MTGSAKPAGSSTPIITQAGNLFSGTLIETVDIQINKNNNSELTINGETKTASEWSTISGISADRIRKRKRNGWSDEDATFKPLDKNHQHN